jgi:hypothetical protein
MNAPSLDAKGDVVHSASFVCLPMLAVAYKLQPNPVIRIGLAVAEVAVGTVELGAVMQPACLWRRPPRVLLGVLAEPIVDGTPPAS